MLWDETTAQAQICSRAQMPYLQVLRGRISILQSVRLSKAGSTDAARPLQLLAARLPLLMRGRPLQLQRLPVCLQSPCTPGTPINFRMP